MRQLTRAEFDALSYRLNQLETQQNEFEAEVPALGALSGSINSAIQTLSGSVVGQFVQLSGTINARFLNLTGSLIASVASLYSSIGAGSTASINQIYSTILAGTSASDATYYTTLQTGVSASDAAVQTSLNAGVTASLAAQYTMMIAGTSASDATYYTTLQVGTSASDADVQSSLKAGVTASLASQYTMMIAGTSASDATYYTAIMAGTSASDSAVQVSLKAGSTSSLASQYTMMIAGTSASDATYYTAILAGTSASDAAVQTSLKAGSTASLAAQYTMMIAGTSASDAAVQTSLKAGVTASFGRWPTDLSVAGSITGSGDAAFSRHLSIQNPNQFRFYSSVDPNWYLGTNVVPDIVLNGFSSGERSFRIRDSAASDITRFGVRLSDGSTFTSGNLLVYGSVTGSGGANINGTLDAVTMIVEHTGTNAYAMEIRKPHPGGTATVRVRLAGGGADLLQIGGGTVSQMQLGPNAFSAPELTITSTRVTSVVDVTANSITGSQVRSDTDFYVNGNPLSGTINAKFASIAAAAGLIKVQVFTTSSAYAPTAGTNKIIVEMVGGGGGGGGVHAISGTYGWARGGGSGGYFRKFFSSLTSATGTVVIGAGGAGGIYNIPQMGSDGGNTEFSINTVTYVAVGGLGGSGSVGASLVTSWVAGTPGRLGTSTGDVTVQGNGTAGGFNANLRSTGGSTVVNPGDSGADSPFGNGGPGVVNSVGYDIPYAAQGSGYGAGGAGPAVTNGGHYSSNKCYGGSGSQGIVLIYEYA